MNQARRSPVTIDSLRKHMCLWSDRHVRFLPRSPSLIAKQSNRLVRNRNLSTQAEAPQHTLLTPHRNERSRNEWNEQNQTANFGNKAGYSGHHYILTTYSRAIINRSSIVGKYGCTLSSARVEGERFWLAVAGKKDFDWLLRSKGGRVLISWRAVRQGGIWHYN